MRVRMTVIIITVATEQTLRHFLPHPKISHIVNFMAAPIIFELFHLNSVSVHG